MIQQLLSSQELSAVNGCKLYDFFELDDSVEKKFIELGPYKTNRVYIAAQQIPTYSFQLNKRTKLTPYVNLDSNGRPNGGGATLTINF